MYGYFWAFAMGMYPEGSILHSHKVIPLVIQPVASYPGWVTAAGLNGWVGVLCNALSRAQATLPAYKIAPFSFSAKLSLM